MDALVRKALRDIGYDVPEKPLGDGWIVKSTLGGWVTVTEIVPPVPMSIDPTDHTIIPSTEGTYLLVNRDGTKSLESSDRAEIAEWAKTVRDGPRDEEYFTAHR